MLQVLFQSAAYRIWQISKSHMQHVTWWHKMFLHTQCTNL